MFCPKCGHSIPDGAAFCPNCGAQRPNPQQEEPVKQQMPPQEEAQPVPEQSPLRTPEISGRSRHVETYSTTYNRTAGQRQRPEYSDDGLATVVQRNTKYYMSEFRKVENGEKTKFNWAAFFFGLYFCLYRKCTDLAKKYFLIPFLLLFISGIILMVGISALALIPMAIGILLAVVGEIWYLINIIRNGRNFNRDYYHHATAVLAKGDPKKYGTSIGMPILVMVLIIVVNIAIALISTAVMVSSLQSSFADNVVDGYYDDAPDIHSIEPELSATPEPQNTTDISAGSSAEPEINNYRRYEGFFATTNSAEDYLSSGGPSVELHVDGEYLYYCVSSQQENYPRSAFLEGFADMDGSSVISFYGEDSWSNLVSGNIYLLDNGNVAVESEVLEYDPNSMWDLGISYVELVPCLSDPTGSNGTVSSDYLYPSDSQYITDYELSQFTHEEIVLIRNEIYARHGCNFNDPTIRSYFESQSWYYPIDGLNASNFDSSVLNEYELTNIDTILAYEREMGWRS